MPELTADEKRERQRQAHRAWVARNPEKLRESKRAYREKNRERLLEEQRAYAAEHRDQAKAASQRWRKANPEKVRAERIAWMTANPEKVRQINQRCAARRRARQHNTVEFEHIDRAAIIARDRSTCHLCGKRVREDIVLDHIIPLALGGAHAPANVAVAHRSCNSRKWLHACNEQLRLIG